VGIKEISVLTGRIFIWSAEGRLMWFPVVLEDLEGGERWCALNCIGGGHELYFAVFSCGSLKGCRVNRESKISEKRARDRLISDSEGRMEKNKKGTFKIGSLR